MKRILSVIALVCLLAGSAFAGAIPITGTIRLSNGNLFNGKIQFTLSYGAARDSTANNIIVAQTVEFPVVNGALPSAAQIVPNDVLQPANTYYTAQYVSSFGTVLAQNVFYISGASFSISQATPTPVTTSNISFGNFTGLTNVTTKLLNNIRMCDQFAGSTAGAKIIACIADLPSTGGIADACGIEGAQTISATVTISKPVTLRICGATYTSTANPAFAITSNGASIEGAGVKVSIIQASGNVGGITIASGLQSVVIDGVEVLGSGGASTAIGILNTNAHDNLISRSRVALFGVGVRYATGINSSYINSIRDSRIESNNTINIEGQLNTNELSLYNVTFGGAPAQTGIKLVDSNTLQLFGGNCEGVTVTCIDLDGTSAFTASHIISGVHFELNSSTGGDIRIGNTATLHGVMITGCLFKPDNAATNLTPINAVRVNGLTVTGNALLSGYNNGKFVTETTTTSVFISGNGSNVTDLTDAQSTANRWFANFKGNGATQTYFAPATYDVNYGDATAFTQYRIRSGSMTAGRNFYGNMFTVRTDNVGGAAGANARVYALGGLISDGYGAQTYGAYFNGEVHVMARLGVNTQSPAYQLDVNGNVQHGDNLYARTPNYVWWNYTAPNMRIINPNAAGNILFRNTGDSATSLAVLEAGGIAIGGTTVSITTGSGAPAGACSQGSLYLRSGGVTTALYACENAIWVAK